MVGNRFCTVTGSALSRTESDPISDHMVYGRVLEIGIR